jgi:hypothetical protein
MISLIMPKSHRDTMEVLFVFLKWVASFAHMDAETGSKMDLGNLATVICPSILYARGRDAMRDETFGALRVITALLENQDEFFTVPVEFLPIIHDQDYFANSLELPGKEFMKKCDTYMRLKGANGRPQPGTPLNGPNNGNMSRYPVQTSPNLERPGMIGPSQSERTIRPMPPPNPSYQNASYPPSGSPAPPQGVLPNLSRMDDWSGPPIPRPTNSGTSSTSRPSSYLGPSRPGADPANTLTSNANGYPSVPRQRT